MQKLRCPECGLAVSVKARARQRRPEPCPRCLARSGGLVSVWLQKAGSEQPPPSFEQRVRALLQARHLVPRG